MTKNARAGEIWSIKGAKTKGHPSIITRKSKKGNIEHIPITHAPKTRKKRNIKLRKNPNLQDLRDSYILSKVQKTKSKNLQRRHDEMKITDSIDKSVIRHIKRKK